MSTYLDQSATNPDLSPTGTPRAPRSEFQLFNLGGGPSKKLDDETLETRVRQRSRLKSLISPPGPWSPQARPILVLGEVGVDRSDAERSRRRLIQGRCRSIPDPIHLKARRALPDVDLSRPISDQSRLITQWHAACTKMGIPTF